MMFPEFSWRNRNEKTIPQIPKPVGTLKKAWWIRVRELKDVRRHCQWLQKARVGVGEEGGWGGGGVLGPCQWRPYSFWLPWINLLAGELWGEGRSGGISSVALLWLSAELSARTHTQNAARHTINTYVHTPQAHGQECERYMLHLDTPASHYSQIHTLH